jgi:adenylosuccinate lyase
MLRETAYKTVQSKAMQSWKEESNFRLAVTEDPQIQSYLSPEKIAGSFSLERQLRNVDAIFDRVFKED